MITWVLTNIKAIGIGLGLIALLTTGAMLYSSIFNAGKLSVEVEHLKMQLATKQDVIRMQQEAMRITTQLVDARNRELELIERDFQELIMEQVDDDQAAESLKELFRRMKEQRK